MGNQFSLSLDSQSVETGFFVGPASEAVAGLRPGGRVCGMTCGQFSMIDLLRATLEKTGPAHLSLSTWTAGIRDAQGAAFLLEQGSFLSCRLLVDRSFATRQPRYCAAVQRLFGDAAIRCTRTHAKVALLENDGWSVAIRSSMNLNRNPRFENFDIDDNAAICALFSRHFDEMESTMPEGPKVRTREVDAVFACIAAGENPFDEDRVNAHIAKSEQGVDSLFGSSAAVADELNHALSGLLAGD